MNDAPSSMVSPGLWGFLAFFVLAVALYLLMRNMNARMRRMSYRSQELARQAEEQEAARREARRRTAHQGDADQDPDDGRGPARGTEDGQAGEPAP